MTWCNTCGMPQFCRTHKGVAIISYCPACRGAAGGRKMSERKKLALLRNLLKARAARAEKRGR